MLTPIRRLALDSFMNLSWYTTEKEGIMFCVYCTFINDKWLCDTYLYAHLGNGLIAHFDGIMIEYVGRDQIREKVKVAKKIETLTLQSVTVRCGNRSATFFIDPALADIEPFYYLNCFGVPEHISLSRITTEKVKADRSIASLGKTSQFYDIQTSKTYEVESALLTSDECLQVEQMLTSPSVRVPFGGYNSIYEMDFDALISILITEFASELSDTDEKPNKVKFMLKTTSKSVHLGLPEYSTTNSIPLSPDGSLDTHIHRSLYAQQRRPCRYFRMEVRRLYPRTQKLYFPAIQFLWRLAQRQVAFLRRVPQNPRLLHHQSQ